MCASFLYVVVCYLSVCMYIGQCFSGYDVTSSCVLSLSPSHSLPHSLPPLPLHRFSEQFHTVERTLCSVPPSPLSQWSDNDEEVIIDVFTSSADQEHYTIEVNPVEDAVMRWVT